VNVEDVSAEVPGVDVGDEHARLILETANDAFISIDRLGVIVEWNQAAERILGWPRHEALGRSLAETVIPERFRRDHHAGIERYLATGEGPVLFETIELAALHASGSELPVELTIWPSRLDGELRFNAFLRDVTERTHMQTHLELLQRVTSAANAADDLEQAIVAALEEVAALTGWPVGHAYVCGWDDDRLEPTGWWTAGAAPFEAFRASTEETSFEPGIGLPGRVAVQRRPALISDLAEDPNFPRQSAARQAGLSSAFAFPVLSGERVVAVLEFYATRPQTPGAQLLELMGNIGVQLGRVFERLRFQSQLHQALEAKSQLLSLLAHEVRTPVVVVDGFAHLMLDDFHDLDGDEVREYLDAIRQHTQRLQRLTTNALRVSRLEAGGQQAQPEAIDLDELLPRLLASLDLSHVPIEGERGLTVHADPDHLEQILINFLTNAMSYGGQPVWIEVRQEPAGEGRPDTVIRVCDRGPGVPASFQPDLFRSFRRGTASGGGSGLGLAISRQLAELNDGDTWHEPLDPGAAFSVRLPAA
jgi:PAS domain S-box-containing protein